MMVSMPGAYAEAFKNEPADFRGIEWGSAYAEHANEMNLVRSDADVLVYMREGDEGESDRDSFMKIAYRFYKDRFSAGIIQTYGNDARKQLQRRLTGTYGEPVKVSRRQELSRSTSRSRVGLCVPIPTSPDPSTTKRETPSLS